MESVSGFKTGARQGISSQAVLLAQIIKQDLEVLYLPQTMCVFEYGINMLHEYACSLVPDDHGSTMKGVSMKGVKLQSICFHYRPHSGAQVKYRKNTDKKWAKIQKNYRKIH